MEKVQKELRTVKARYPIATITTTSEARRDAALELHRVSGLTYEDIFFHGVEALTEKWKGIE